jgi:hypothetical protein
MTESHVSEGHYKIDKPESRLVDVEPENLVEPSSSDNPSQRLRHRVYLYPPPLDSSSSIFLTPRMATQLLNTPSTHQWSLVATLDSGKLPFPPQQFLTNVFAVWNIVRDTFIDVGSGPVAGLAQAAVLSFVQSSCLPHFAH